jgi:hypothetical protein
LFSCAAIVWAYSNIFIEKVYPNTEPLNLEVRTDKERYNFGDPIEVQVTVIDPSDGEPVGDADVMLRVIPGGIHLMYLQLLCFKVKRTKMGLQHFQSAYRPRVIDHARRATTSTPWRLLPQKWWKKAFSQRQEPTRRK